MALTEATIGGLFGLGSSVAGSLFEGASVRRQLKAQKELAKYQFDLNKAQWDAENEYNTPSAQMSRLQAAGLNPNLVYDKGTVSGNTTTAGPRYEAPNADMRQRFDFGNAAAQAIGMYQDFRMKSAQIDNVEAQTQAVQENTNLTKVQAAWNLLKKESDDQYLNAERSRGLSKTFADEVYANTRAALTEQQRRQQDSLFPYQLQAQQLQNRNARQALTNALLDATLKKDTHTLNEFAKYSAEADTYVNEYYARRLRKYGVGAKESSNPVSAAMGYGLSRFDWILDKILR